jgi:hypothetical protein
VTLTPHVDHVSTTYASADAADSNRRLGLTYMFCGSASIAFKGIDARQLKQQDTLPLADVFSQLFSNAG